MPTLREFIEETLTQNNMQEDPAAIQTYIEEEAEERAKDNNGNCVCISDEDVRQMIINYPTLAAEQKAKLEQEAKEKEEKKKQEEEKKAKAEEEKKQKAAEKEEKAKAKEIEKANAGEQQSLF